MTALGARGLGGSLGPHLVRWSWIAASVLGAATLGLLFFDVASFAAGGGYFAQAFLLAVSYPLVLLPMFLLKSVVQGRPWRMVVSTVLGALGLLFCSVLLLFTDSVLEYALELAWTVALAAAVAYMWAVAAGRRFARNS